MKKARRRDGPFVLYGRQRGATELEEHRQLNPKLPWTAPNYLRDFFAGLLVFLAAFLAGAFFAAFLGGALFFATFFAAAFFTTFLAAFLAGAAFFLAAG